jgi:hypothetical protein
MHTASVKKYLELLDKLIANNMGQNNEALCKSALEAKEHVLMDRDGRGITCGDIDAIGVRLRRIDALLCSMGFTRQKVDDTMSYLDVRYSARGPDGLNRRGGGEGLGGF